MLLDSSIRHWDSVSAGITGSRYDLHLSPVLRRVLRRTATDWRKQYIIVTPNNLTAASLVIQYWVPREKVNPGAFIAVFLVAVVLINYFGVSFFGEFEFYLSSIKVMVIIGLILLSLILACGGGPDGHATGFEYWKDPGAFHEYILSKTAPTTSPCVPY